MLLVWLENGLRGEAQHTGLWVHYHIGNAAARRAVGQVQDLILVQGMPGQGDPRPCLREVRGLWQDGQRQGELRALLLGLEELVVLSLHVLIHLLQLLQHLMDTALWDLYP